MKGFFKKKSLGLMGLGNSARTPLDQKKIKKKKVISFDQSISQSETLTRVIHTNFQKKKSKSAKMSLVLRKFAQLSLRRCDHTQLILV
jgi:hypothetical protein